MKPAAAVRAVEPRPEAAEVEETPPEAGNVAESGEAPPVAGEAGPERKTGGSASRKHRGRRGRG
jgi:hypothetical protein